MHPHLEFGERLVTGVAGTLMSGAARFQPAGPANARTTRIVVAEPMEDASPRSAAHSARLLGFLA